MDCNCIKDTKINYIFQVDQINKENIIYLDYSDWATIDIGSKYTITIQDAGGKYQKNLEVSRGTITKISSKDYGKDFCDGVYCAEIDSCGIKFKKRFALTYELNCGLTKIYAKHPDKAQEVKNNIDDIHNLVASNYLDEALKLYTITEKILANYNCNCN